MNRRLFLGLALASVAPALIATSFAEGPTTDLAALTGAWDRARSTGRPLLVIVIPASTDALWERGRAWGELINHGSERARALLGQVELVCAHAASLRVFAPGVEEEPDAWAWVISTDRVPAMLRSVQVVQPPLPDPWEGRGSDNWEQVRRREDEVIDARILAFTASLAGAITPLTGGVDHLDANTRSVLAAETKDRFATEAPANARWAQARGCGVVVEGENDNMRVGCGMGHVPLRSARMLWFFQKASIFQ